ncbi:MAG: HAD-IA family hydrolase, partial [Longicatena sp.]
LKSRVKSFADLERKIMMEIEDPKEGEEIIARISQFLLEHYDNAPLKKDALNFLEYLKNKGYIICLCTNNATEVVQHILEEKNIASYFDFVVTSQQVTKAKPDPQMYLEAMKNIHLTPAECCVFEDTESGVEAARNAGITDIFVVQDKDKKKFSSCITIRDFSEKCLYELL